MTCYSPLRAFYAAEVNPSGKRSLVFKREGAFSGVPVRIPCGQCIGCKLERARQWAMRVLHEQKCSLSSDFVTLTYDDKSLPKGGTLVRTDPQLFLKRLRKSQGPGVRFFGCGEYGGVTSRPHYHIILFNAVFPDRRFYKFAKGGERLFLSRELERIWGHGLCVIGDVTFQSASYVARYVCEKITGPTAEAHYAGRLPEFLMQSLKPGIGKLYFDKFGAEAYLHDSVVVDGREVRPPRYYDKYEDLVDPARLAVLKRKRRREALKHAENNTPERRRVREQVIKVNLARVARKEV